MKKDEYIAKYGEAAYEEYKLKNRNWCKEHREQRNQLNKKWCKEHREQHYQTNKKWVEGRRITGCTRYCNENYDLIENYELAKSDNFDPKKWHLHHRLENYWSKATLKRKGLYDNVNPEALIWLPYDEHKKDASLSTFHPELTKWHKRSLENE